MVKSLKEKMLERRIARLEKLIKTDRIDICENQERIKQADLKRRCYNEVSIYKEDPYYANMHVILHVSDLRYGSAELFRNSGGGTALIIELEDAVVTVDSAFRGGDEVKAPRKINFKYLWLYADPSDTDASRNIKTLIEYSTTDEVEIRIPNKKITMDCYPESGEMDLSLGWSDVESGHMFRAKDIPVIIDDNSGNKYNFVVDCTVAKTHEFQLENPSSLDSIR